LGNLPQSLSKPADTMGNRAEALANRAQPLGEPFREGPAEFIAGVKARSPRCQ
jgi:hypothetical protein